MACLMCRDAKFCVSTMGVRIVQIGVVQSMCRVFGCVETQNFASLRLASAIIMKCLFYDIQPLFRYFGIPNAFHPVPHFVHPHAGVLLRKFVDFFF